MRPNELRGLLACVLSASCLQAHAADNCQIQISNAAVDYGSTSRAELLKRQVSPLAMGLGKHSVTLTATCRTPTLMTLFFRGAGSDGESYRMGRGGRFTLRAYNARLDGRAVGLGSVTEASQAPQNKADTLPLPPGGGVVPIVSDVPVKGTSLQVQVEVDASILTTRSRVADRTEFRGAGNFELVEN